jgi:hypothetical protein
VSKRDGFQETGTSLFVFEQKILAIVRVIDIGGGGER